MTTIETLPIELICEIISHLKLFDIHRCIIASSVFHIFSKKQYEELLYCRFWYQDEYRFLQYCFEHNKCYLLKYIQTDKLLSIVKQNSKPMYDCIFDFIVAELRKNDIHAMLCTNSCDIIPSVDILLQYINNKDWYNMNLHYNLQKMTNWMSSYTLEFPDARTTLPPISISDRRYMDTLNCYKTSYPEALVNGEWVHTVNDVKEKLF